MPIPSGGKGLIYSLRWCWDQLPSIAWPPVERPVSERQKGKLNAKAEHPFTAPSGPGPKLAAKSMASKLSVQLIPCPGKVLLLRFESNSTATSDGCTQKLRNNLNVWLFLLPLSHSLIQMPLFVHLLVFYLST